MNSAGALYKKPILVSAAAILRPAALASRSLELPDRTRLGPEVLIAQRKLDAKSEPGKWEFPGGKIEFGESPQASLKREICEELALEIEVGELLTVVSHVYAPETAAAVHVVLVCYLCQLSAASSHGVFRALDAADAKWISITSLDNINLNDYAAADHAVIQALRERYAAILT